MRLPVATWQRIVDIVDDDVIYILLCTEGYPGEVLSETDTPPTIRGNRELARDWGVEISPVMVHSFHAMGDRV